MKISKKRFYILIIIKLIHVLTKERVSVCYIQNVTYQIQINIWNYNYTIYSLSLYIYVGGCVCVCRTCKKYLDMLLADQ